MGIGLDGKATRVGYVNSLSASVYGTALDMTTYTHAKLCCGVTENFSATEEVDDGVGCGSGSGFVSDFKLGQKEYRAQLNGILGFANGFDRLLAQFFGAESVPAEQTVGQDDWKHIFKFATLANQRFGTLAWETSSDSIIEMPSVYVQKIQITMEKVQGYVKWNADVVGNTAKYSSPTNSNADLAGLIVLSDERVFSECVHTFRMKAINDDGADTAPNSGDQFNITNYDLELETPMEVIPEMTGGVCSKPSQSDYKSGTLAIGLKEHTSNTNTYQAWEAGTNFTCEIEWKGQQIGSGVNASYRIRIPKMRLANSPGYSINNPGKNPVNLVFKLLESVHTLSGYTTKAVEIDVINGQEAAYLL